jgi:hypothetical protein
MCVKKFNCLSCKENPWQDFYTNFLEYLFNFSLNVLGGIDTRHPRDNKSLFSFKKKQNYFNIISVYIHS